MLQQGLSNPSCLIHNYGGSLDNWMHLRCMRNFFVLVLALSHCTESWTCKDKVERNGQSPADYDTPETGKE